jgi:hypothetical protein
MDRKKVKIKKDRKRNIKMDAGNTCHGEKVTVEKKTRSFFK